MVLEHGYYLSQARLNRIPTPPYSDAGQSSAIAALSSLRLSDGGELSGEGEESDEGELSDEGDESDEEGEESDEEVVISVEDCREMAQDLQRERHEALMRARLAREIGDYETAASYMQDVQHCKSEAANLNRLAADAIFTYKNTVQYRARPLSHPR